MSDEVVARLVAGYELVDDLVGRGLDLFAYGNSGLWLELNAMVLCGDDPSRRKAFAVHIAATEARFYAEPGAGIGGIADWHERHRQESTWLRAAGVYVRLLSEPQLFIEGNHRTGALIMSWILASAGRPPFVLTLDNAVGYFDPSAVIKGTRKTAFALLVQVPRIKKRFARFLEGQADRRFLCAPTERRGLPPLRAAPQAPR